MSVYNLVTTWKVAAPLPEVWAKLQEVESWPLWWRGVHTVQRKDQASTEIGAIYYFHMQGALPYTVRFTIEVTGLKAHQFIIGKSTGDLQGNGTWQFDHHAGVTTTIITWQVSPTKRWMKLLSPIAKPILIWNHDVLMRRGLNGLRKALGAEGKKLG